MKPVVVDIIGDAVGEADEHFRLDIRDPQNAATADGSAIGTVINDDVPRDGSYVGTTSQGQPISLEVVAGARGVRKLQLVYVLHLPGAPGVTRRLAPAEIPVGPAPSWEFRLSDDYTSPDGSLHVVFSLRGQLAVPGSASGTFSTLWEFSNGHRWETGEVTWTAS